MTASRPPTRAASRGRWALIGAVVLALILVPFALLDETITAWSVGVIEGSTGDGLVAGLIGSLLTLDVVLPVPSSVLSTAAGYRLGLLGGALVTWSGMTLGCLLAWVLGSRWGHGPTERLVGVASMGRVSAAMRRNALWVLAAFRPVPVLAEASVLLAGVTRLPLGRFLVVTGLANLGVAFAYAWVGARSAEVGSFLLAFGGALLLPAVAIWLARRFGRDTGAA